MNAHDILKYGQLTLLKSLDGLPETASETPGACGRWSVKDILAHLASYEQVLVDVLHAATGGDRTPTLDRFIAMGEQFNDQEVAARAAVPLEKVLVELADAHSRSCALLSDLPSEFLCQNGTLPWYGLNYALDDLLVYMYYGHKREHSAQIAAFSDRLSRHETVELPEEHASSSTSAVVDQFNAAFNRHDISAIMALMTDDCIFENTNPAPDGERFVGHVAVQRAWEELFRASPQALFHTEEVVVAGDRCVVRWRYEWKDDTEQSGHVRGVDVFRVRDGKVAEKLAYVKG